MPRDQRGRPAKDGPKVSTETVPTLPPASANATDNTEPPGFAEWYVVFEERGEKL